MATSGMRGIDLLKIAGRSISGWIKSLKTGNPHHVRQPFCSQLEERLLMYLEYHTQVAWYARCDIDAHFAATYRLSAPKHAPFAIGYVFEGQPHDYLPDVVGTLANGKLFVAEAELEDEKRAARQQAKAEAAKSAPTSRRRSKSPRRPQRAAGEAKAQDAPNEPPPLRDEVGETQRVVPSTKCSFSGPIELEAGRLLEATVELVQCPTCGSVSKAKLKGQSRVIASHPPRKSRPVRNVTHWAEQGATWILFQKQDKEKRRSNHFQGGTI